MHGLILRKVDRVISSSAAS